MKYRHALAFLALALGLGGCASTSSNYRADARDGSYYSPADAGYGDYYYAPEPRYDYYYDHSYFYGSPFWHDPFLYPYYRFGFNTYYGWYDPFWGPYAYYPWQERPRHDDANADDADDDDVSSPSGEVAIEDENPRAIDGAGPRRQLRQRWFGPYSAAPASAENNLRVRARTAGDPLVRSRSEPEPRRSERSSASDESASAPSRPSRRGSDRGGRQD
jgi:hypothetical protein